VILKTSTYYENSIDPFIPEWWANETLVQLEEQMIASALVNRDFESMFQNAGDIVNTRRPGEFVGKRKAKNDSITIQDATSENVAIKLNQHCHVSFSIKDIEETMAMRSLIDLYARPAAVALARMIDKMVLGQYTQFMKNSAGKLNGVTRDNIKDFIIDLRQVLDDTKAYETGRNLILTSKTEGDCLRPEWFTSADKVGDNGTALRNASIGHKLGFDFFKSLNMANVLNFTTFRDFLVNLVAGYNIGTTTLLVDTGTGEITPGSWIDINGIPYRVIARVGTAPTTSITIESPGLKSFVADNTIVRVFTPGAVNLAAGYEAGYDKYIVVSGFTAAAPKTGQLVTFGNAADRYAIMDVIGNTQIMLDRPLEQTILNADTVNIGPNGAYNFAFHRDAMTLAIRGLAPVRSGAGARSSSASMNGLTMRATIGYDIRTQEHIWTLDFLAGIKVLDEKLGAVMYG